MTGDKRYYMACLDLEGRRCLVVGGGRVGLEKAKGLLDCGAVVTVVAPQIEPELAAAAGRAGAASAYETADLDGNLLVVAATPVRSVNRRVFTGRRGAVAARATSSTRPSSAASSSPPSTGATRSRSPSRPAARRPRWRKRLRDELGRPDRRGARRPRPAPARRCGPWARRHYPTYAARREYFESTRRGVAAVTVFLVGAGPGDPGLITARGPRARPLVRRARPRPAGRDELVEEAPADAIRDRPRARSTRTRSTGCSCSTAGAG